MNMRRKLLIAAVILLAIPVLAFAALVLLANPDRYRDALINDLSAQTGATLVLDEPLEWQLWPAGIRASGVTLLDAEKKPLLKAQKVIASIQLRDLLQGSHGIKSLSLQQVDARVDIAKDGSSNWDSVIEKISVTNAQSLESFTIQKMHLIWHTAEHAKDILIDADKLVVSELGSKAPLIDSEFLISRQDQQGGNLLLQNTFKTRLYKRDDGWLLKGSRLISIVSSTYIPGQSSIDLQADFQVIGKTLSSPGFRALMLYKNMNMPQPEQAMLSASLEANTSNGALSVGNVLFKSSGKAASQLKAQAITSNWKTQEFAAQQLSFSTFMDGKEFSLPANQAISFSYRLGHQDDRWQLQDLAVDIGQSQLQGDVSIGLTEQGPHYQAQLFGKAVSAADLAAFLNVTMQGEMDFKLDVDAAGRDLSSLLENGKGKFSLKLKNGRLDTLSIPAKLWERLEQSRNLLPDLAESSPVLDNSGTDIKSLVIESLLEDGLVKTTTFSADFAQLTLKASGEYHAKAKDFDYKGQLSIEKSFFNNSKKPYNMPIECQGNLLEENLTFLEALEVRCGMSPEAKREVLTNALRRRFLDLGKEARQQLEQSQQP